MDAIVSKLILLYVLEQMEIPVTTDTINDMCCSQNNWLTYMTLTQIIPDLLQTRFIVSYTNNNTEYFKITQEGTECLKSFFVKVPASIRKEISLYIKKNRQSYKRKQEYFKDYFKNKDGSYTVSLKILDPLGSKLELKLNVANRAEAIDVYKKWDASASDVYSSIYKILIDGE